MTASDYLAGLPRVPASTYQTIHSHQIISWLEWDGEPRDMPVMMRGSLHCRIASRSDDRGTARRYATAVLERYIRRLRITETDPVRWYGWLTRHLMRVAHRRSWWSSRWQNAVENDLRWLVCEYSVLIDGERHDVYDPEQMQNVRKLARNARKFVGVLPTLPVRVGLSSKAAIGILQN